MQAELHIWGSEELFFLVMEPWGTFMATQIFGFK